MTARVELTPAQVRADAAYELMTRDSSIDPYEMLEIVIAPESIMLQQMAA